VVLVLATIAVATNLAQFPGIERTTPANVRAIYRPGTADLMELMLRDCAGRCVQRYGLQVSLGLLAPGSRVYLPRPTAIMPDPDAAEEFLSELRGFGAVRRVDFVDASVADRVLAALDPTPYLVARGGGGQFGPAWAIAVSPGAADAIADPYAFLRDAVVDGPPAWAAPRDFVIVRWVPTGPVRDKQVDLAVETSLLPVELRTDLPR
jgi:hypothetical protein